MDINQEIQRLKTELEALKQEFYKTNFSARQDFYKFCDFKSRLKVPSYSTNPSTCEVGELIENGGVLYVCSSANTWTKVGLQS